MVVSSPIKDIETIQQIKILYQKQGEDKHLLLFLLAINTGANLKDLLDLNVEDIKDKEFLALENRKTIPLNDEIKILVKQITENKKLDEPLFSGKRKSRCERTAVFYKFKSIRDELALDENINVSSWRKTFGYMHYKKYKDLSYLQWFFGQNSVEQTMEYIGIKENMNLRCKEGIAL